MHAAEQSCGSTCGIMRPQQPQHSRRTSGVSSSGSNGTYVTPMAKSRRAAPKKSTRSTASGVSHSRSPCEAV